MEFDLTIMLISDIIIIWYNNLCKLILNIGCLLLTFIRFYTLMSNQEYSILQHILIAYNFILKRISQIILIKDKIIIYIKNKIYY